MKKSFVNIFCLLLCGLILAGCGEKQEAFREKPNIRKVVNIELEPMSDEESLEMINFMSGGRACIAGDRLYSMEFDENLKPCLASYEINEAGISDFKILASDCTPEFLSEYEGRLYYINSSAGGRIESLASDGSDRKTIIAEKSDFLRVKDGNLYYTDSKQRFCKSGTGGENSQIIMPEACCYPYVIGEKLLYQKARNEHLYLYDFNDGSDMEISDTASYGPIIINDRLYCTVEDGVYSTDLQGLSPLKYELRGIQGTVEYNPSAEGLIISGVSNDGGIHSWSFKADNARESFRKTPGGGYRICEFRGEDAAAFTEFEPEGRIRSFIFESSGGGEIRYKKGETR